MNPILSQLFVVQPSKEQGKLQDVHQFTKKNDGDLVSLVYNINHQILPLSLDLRFHLESEMLPLWH
jgi:hypothetical protein